MRNRIVWGIGIAAIVVGALAGMFLGLGWLRNKTSTAAKNLPAASPVDRAGEEGTSKRGIALKEAVGDPDTRAVLDLTPLFPGQAGNGLQHIRSNWKPEFIPMLLDILPLLRDPQILQGVIGILEAETGQAYGYNLQAWYQWLWNQPATEHDRYDEFKATYYSAIDPRFAEYFSSESPRTIRLDEVRWGGVRQDGIPPLRGPKMIAAAEATYLEDDNVVFGIAVNGDVRAYPKRILAWHEMFVDTVGGVPVTGVYCTLCGTVILYESTTADGVTHEFGTSGFLYRSNKLMYDRATNSLWVTLLGQPVIGPLAETDVTLKHRSVVTTTWGEWKRRHPETQVLSLDTGHVRDYGEGIAYQEYFATDDLMFNVPNVDQRLKNKDEVLGLLFPEHSDRPLAIGADFLLENPVYHDRVGDLELVVLTDPSGANRVYDSAGLRFTRYDGDRGAIDSEGRRWEVTEDGLLGPDGRRLNRLPAFRAFWFGWYAAYAHSRLVQ